MMLRARNKVRLQVEQLESREVPALFGSMLGSLSVAAPAPAHHAHVAPAATLPTATPAAGTQLSAMDTAIIAYTNQEREAHGLAPLQVNSKLMSAANYQAAWMAALQTMSHTLPDPLPTPQSRLKYFGYQWQWWGENIAYGYTTARSVTTAWWNSPEHRANILNAHFTQIGVAVHYSTSGVPYYCVDFGEPV
jgi:uncharacterized protein YkwD